MKVELVTDTEQTPFTPFTVTIEVENKDEAMIIEKLAYLDSSIPAALRPFLDPDQRRALNSFQSLLAARHRDHLRELQIRKRAAEAKAAAEAAAKTAASIDDVSDMVVARRKLV